MKVFFEEAVWKDQAAHVIFFKNKPVCFKGPALNTAEVYEKKLVKSDLGKTMRTITK